VKIGEIADSPLWDRLLCLTALPLSPYSALTQPLLTMRESGTSLRRLDTGVYGLRPIVKEGCWESADAYKAKAAELLKPHHDQLIELLQAFTIRIDAELKHGSKGDGNEKARIAAHLDINGYCAIESEALNGEIIYFARDRGTVISKVPKGKVAYTLDELKTLRDRPPESNEALRKLHEAKRIFSGTILSGEVMAE
jgi:hypothetical protein